MKQSCILPVGHPVLSPTGGRQLSPTATHHALSTLQSAHCLPAMHKCTIPFTYVEQQQAAHGGYTLPKTLQHLLCCEAIPPLYSFTPLFDSDQSDTNVFHYTSSSQEATDGIFQPHAHDAYICFEYYCMLTSAQSSHAYTQAKPVIDVMDRWRYSANAGSQ